MGVTGKEVGMNLLARLQTELRQKSNEIPDPQPPFQFQIGWSNDYDQLFESQEKPDKFSAIEEPDSLVTRALSNGRVLLHARGGSAKTVILGRLIRRNLTEQFLPVWIDLKRWLTPDYREWDKQETVVERLNFILQMHTDPQLNTVVFDALPMQTKRVLFVDGLNELVSNIAEEILDVLDEFAGLVPNSGVIVTDRLVRRNLRDPAAWCLATIMPIKGDEVRAQLTKRFGNAEIYEEASEPSKTLLASPYFLNAALRFGRAAMSSSAVHEAIFREHVNLTEAELECVAKAGFQAYQGSSTRTFTLSEFASVVSPTALTKLTREKTLLVTGTHAQFDHHLRHDYLAARYLAERQELWTPDVFTSVTFRASSFEVLAMALEQLPNTELADLFVRRVYDWNQYGAAYAVSEGRQRGSILVSKQMEVILLAMLADRRWDLLEKTAQRVMDALHMFGTDESRAFLAAQSQEEVYRFVAEYPTGDHEFSRWRTLFTCPKEISREPELQEILNADSLIGWTVANVLKRFRLTDGQQVTLRQLFDEASATVRWRIVHVLGAFPNPNNIAVLTQALDSDPDEWVKYGAVRSLMEMAALGNRELRWRILEAIKDRLPTITRIGRVLDELERAIFIDPRRSPQDWPELAIDLLKALNSQEQSSEKREHWSDVAYRVYDRYNAIGV
jgi:hypothetical protein